MSTVSIEGLQALLEAMDLDGPDLASKSPDIQYNPLSICFRHLADALVQLTNCDQQVAYKSISWSTDMTHLVVVVPRLRIRDVKAEDLAADLQQRVSLPSSPSDESHLRS